MQLHISTHSPTQFNGNDHAHCVDEWAEICNRFANYTTRLTSPSWFFLHEMREGLGTRQPRLHGLVGEIHNHIWLHHQMQTCMKSYWQWIAYTDIASWHKQRAKLRNTCIIILSHLIVSDSLYSEPWSSLLVKLKKKTYLKLLLVFLVLATEILSTLTSKLLLSTQDHYYYIELCQG